MKRMTIKTYLTIPVFLGMLLLTGQVSADETLVPAPTPANPTVTTEAGSGVPTTPAPANFPEQGSHTFTERSGVKAEPKVSSPNLDYYEVGETANYDKTVEEDNNLWISYTSYAGTKSYVSVGQLEEVSDPTPAPAPPEPASAPVETTQPTSESTIQPTEPNLPASGTYTFTARTGVKSVPKISAPDRAHYTAGEKVNYDKTLEQDNHLWLTYVNYSGGRSYVAVKELKPAALAPVSQPSSPVVAPAATPSSTPSVSASLPSRGTYTFTEKVGVKSEPKLSAPDRAHYTAGEKVNYDKTLEADSHLWLSYINYSGGRSYVAVKELKPVAPASTPVSQPSPPVVAPAATPSSTPSTSASLPSRGTYTFTEKVGVKSEPKLSAPDRAYYTAGEKVNYDKTLEQDNHLWLSYVNYSGGRSYVAVKELKPAAPAPVSQPSAPAPVVAPSSSSSSSTSLPARGTYTFTAKTGVKSEPKISAPDRAHYTAGEKVNYDKTLEQDNHLWLSYVNYSGGRSYVAVKELKPAAPAPVSQPSAPAPVVAPSSSSSSSTSLPARGTYTFTAKTGVKSEPKLSAPDRAHYTAGEKVNYDKTLEADSHLWLSYINYSGGRSYVAVKELKPVAPAPVSQPSAPSPVVAPSSSSSSSTSLPARGTYTFTAKTGVKSEPKLSAPDRAHYTAGEKVNYDKTLEADSHLWLSYINYSGGRSYVAVKELKPAAPAPVSQPSAPVPVVAPSSSSSSSTSLPARGTYTFTAKTGVKSEPKISAPDRDYYTPGERVNYDKTLEQDNHLWLSYVNYSGGRSYVAVKELKPVAPVVVPISTETGRPIAQPSSPSVQPSTPTQPEIPVEQPTVPASTEAPVSESTSSETSVGQTDSPTVTAQPEIPAEKPTVPTQPEIPVEQPTVPDSTEAPISESTSSEASVGQTDSPTVTAQPEIPAEKPTVTETISSPAQPTPPVAPAPAPKPVQTSPAFPSRGVYTFTEKTGVKSQPRLISPNRDYYYPGEKVNYDKTLEADDHLWLSYVNYSGGRSYVAIQPLKRQLTEEELKAEAAKKHNAQVAVTDYQENKTNFTVQVTGQEDTKRMSKVRIAVWSDDKGQDDLRWYEPVIESNKAQAKVSIANHSNSSDTYKVQVYTTYSDKEIVASPIIDQVIVKPSLEEIYESSVVNSASESVKKIFQIAGELLGVQGGGAAHKQLVDDYNAVKPLPVGYKVTYEDDWCDVFTTVVFQRAGLTHLIGRECGVERHIGIFQNLGIWNEDGTTTPKMGDIITFNWDQNRQANNGFADHIAIVTHVENGLIHTIEGNKDNEVKRHSYKIGDGNIRGFARPRYI